MSLDEITDPAEAYEVLRLGGIEIDVELGEVGWGGFHTWVDGESTWVDGTFIRDGQRTSALDVGCLGDKCCVPRNLHDQVRRSWEQGSVFAFAPYNHAPLALVVPEDTLTTETISEALRRFNP